MSLPPKPRSKGPRPAPLPSRATPAAKEGPPRGESFRELIGEVEELPPGPLRRSSPVESAPSVVVRGRDPSVEFVVETHEELVIGHRKDVAARLAHELGRDVPRVHRTVDLHRLNAQEAATALAEAVLRALREGTRCLLVVHGKGTHSKGGGAVLPDVVLGELTGRLSSHVAAFRTAPRSHGGSGALVVRLR